MGLCNSHRFNFLRGLCSKGAYLPVFTVMIWNFLNHFFQKEAFRSDGRNLRSEYFRQVRRVSKYSQLARKSSRPSANRLVLGPKQGKQA